MTKKEWEMVRELSQCSFAPATWDKKMARSYPTEKKAKLSPAQKAWLPALHYKYRRQIAEHRKRVTAKDGA